MKPKVLAHLGKTWVIALSVGALAPLLGGCGGGDTPQGITVKMGFENLAEATGASSGNDVSGPYTTGPTVGPAVKSIVVGALVLTHRNTPYTDANEVDNANNDALEEDAKQSAKYFTVVSIPSDKPYVSFLIPPDGAGPWLLVGVALRYEAKSVDDLSNLPDDAPIWFGFAYYTNAAGQAEFLNNHVKPGDTLQMVMQPACAYTPNGLNADTTLCPPGSF